MSQPIKSPWNLPIPTTDSKLLAGLTEEEYDRQYPKLGVIESKEPLQQGFVHIKAGKEPQPTETSGWMANLWKWMKA